MDLICLINVWFVGILISTSVSGDTDTKEAAGDNSCNNTCDDTHTKASLTFIDTILVIILSRLGGPCIVTSLLWVFLDTLLPDRAAASTSPNQITIEVEAVAFVQEARHIATLALGSLPIALLLFFFPDTNYYLDDQ